MRYLPFKQFVCAVALMAGVGSVAALAQQIPPLYSVGSPATAEDLGSYAWTSGASGVGLPPGQGTAKEGEMVYLTKCAMCHGRSLEGVTGNPQAQAPYAGPRLLGNAIPKFRMEKGQVDTHPWRHGNATAVFNVIAVEMPFYRPGTLTATEVYQVTAYVLAKNGIIKEDEVMNKQTLPKVPMPNRDNAPGGPTGRDDEKYMDMLKRGCWKTFGECRQG